MPSLKRQFLKTTTGLLAGLLLAAGASAQTFPAKPVNLMVPSVGHAEEVLWRKWCSGDADTILRGVWSLERVEAELDRLPDNAYPNGNSDLLFFEHQGRGCDQLRTATWNVVRRHIEGLRRVGAAADVIALGEQSLEDLNRTFPSPPMPPEDFAAELTLKQLVEELLPKIVALRVASVLAEAQARA